MNADADLWREIGDVSRSTILEDLWSVSSPMLDDFDETYKAARPHTALFFAQAWVENRYQTTGHIIKPADHNPVSLRPEIYGELGPYGYGIIRAPNEGQFLAFKTDADCAREWKRRLITDRDTYKNGVYAHTDTLTSMLAIYAPPGDVHPITGVDNAEINYESKVRSILRRYGTMESEREDAPDVGGSQMAEYAINWPGVPGGPLIFDVPVSAMIVPQWRTQQRPGIKARSPREGIAHENGNPDALARQDSIYLYNGAGGRSASWHATVDHKEIIANLPADEVGWQASDGAGPGNMRGFAIELSQWPIVYGTPAQWRQARRNSAQVGGRVGARLNITPPSKRHRDFAPDRKNCPQYMNGNPVWWDEYVDDWLYYYNDERARMSGGGSVTEYEPGDRIVTIARAINLRVGYGTDYKITNTLPAGTLATVIADDSGNWQEFNDGYPWLNIRLDEGGTGWMAIGSGSEEWVERSETAPIAPEPEIEYADVAPVPELLETAIAIEDKYNVAEGITSIDGQEFIFVADLIEFIEPTEAKRFGMDDSPVVKRPYEKGEHAIAAWLVKARNGKYYYLLTGEDDEWVRVEYTSTVRIADAPLDGNDVE